MKTKIVPFDLETAKKIQAGEIEGKIKTQCGDNVRALCIKDEMAAAIIVNDGNRSELLFIYDKNGVPMSSTNVIEKKLFQLVLEILEIPDNEPQFKPFDRVLVRDEERECWHATLFSHYADSIDFPYFTANGYYAQCISFEGNENLIGTKNEPKED